jgi:hypothetical protein
MPPDITVERMHEEIQSIRRMLAGDTQGSSCVLVVDNNSPILLRILGAAIDLDPTFLWRHHNAELDRYSSFSDVNTLRNRFYSLVATEKHRRLGRNMNQHSSVAQSGRDGSIHITYLMEKRFGPQSYRVTSRISCYRPTMNNCS